MIVTVFFGVFVGIVASVVTAGLGGGLLLSLTAYALTGALGVLAGSVAMLHADTLHNR